MAASENIKRYTKNIPTSYLGCLEGKEWTFGKKFQILVQILGPGRMALPGK